MRKRNNRGFTMAELLVVVAIIGVLAGVSFVAVQRHQRSLTQLERNTVAKELYFAAQNHLTMAESQGLLNEVVEESFYGNVEVEDDIYYVIADGGASFNGNTILNLMLPFGAIDETVRTGGFYIIRYQANPAIVLDVFYCSKSGEPEKYNYTKTVSEFTEDDYASFLKYRDDGLPASGYVVGWYGGATPGKAGTYLKTPSLTVTNGEKLIVTVKNPNNSVEGAQIMLMVKGVSSGAQAAFALDGTAVDDRVNNDDSDAIVITLDDISKQDSSYGFHFADLNDSMQHTTNVGVIGTFKPGEDIVVVAVSFSNEKQMNIAYSNEVTTNSLFADVETVNWGTDEAPDNRKTAYINNIRHLENLDDDISNLNRDVSITHARQLVDLAAPAEGDVSAKDLSWNGFMTAVRSDDTAPVQITGYYESASPATAEDTFRPVSPSYALTYDGNNHSIEGITVNCAGNAGLFGALGTDSKVSNLELINFDIAATGDDANAGALAGSLNQTTVTNVLARNTAAFEAAIKAAAEKPDDAPGKREDPATVVSSGNAGGLIGVMSTNTNVIKSAAALTVKGADAGGLIGASNGGTVNGCYSGGHTVKDTRTGSDAVIYDPAKPNVKASGTGNVAGGLIGDAGAAAISNSYSTCSVEGATAGGLVGTATGDITNCYATGLVKGTTVEGAFGAFAGTYSTGTLSGNHCFEIINELLPVTGDGYTYLEPVGKYFEAGKVVDHIDLKGKVDAIDETAATYNEFTFDSSDVHYAWQKAVPYNATLTKYYGGDDGALYVLRTVKQLDAEVEDSDFVATHYGDWPAPEIFVINAKKATP